MSTTAATPALLARSMTAFLSHAEEGSIYPVVILVHLGLPLGETSTLVRRHWADQNDPNGLLFDHWGRPIESMVGVLIRDAYPAFARRYWRPGDPAPAITNIDELKGFLRNALKLPRRALLAPMGQYGTPPLSWNY